MGTNYYLHTKPACECCGRPYEPLHIGKSSYGWRFALHVIPEMNLNSLDDWKKLWNIPGSVICDEYGNDFSAFHMEDIITNRELSDGRKLRRHKDGHCMGHGEGSWDYIVGEFS